MDTYRLYVDGNWREAEGGKSFPFCNPSAGQVWAMVPEASPADVSDAVSAVRRVFELARRAVSGTERATRIRRSADLLERKADRFALLEGSDNGKVVRETRSEMSFAAKQYRVFAGYADKLWGSIVSVDKPDVFDYPRGESFGPRRWLLAIASSPSRQSIRR